VKVFAVLEGHRLQAASFLPGDLQGQAQAGFDVVVDLPGGVQIQAYTVGRFVQDGFVQQLHTDQKRQPSDEDADSEKGRYEAKTSGVDHDFAEDFSLIMTKMSRYSDKIHD
jgi:hypothetical protein